MADYYHVDGTLVPVEEATVSVRDRGFMYGDAAFETLRVYAGRPFAWKRHADRLRRTCETLGFADALPGREDLHERIVETVTANGLTDAYTKLSVTRGVQPGKLAPNSSVDPTIVVMVSELPRGGVDGKPVWSEPATVETVETRRIPDSAVPANAKTHNYLNGILARRESEGDEALLYSTDGYVTEGATSNCFFVRDGTLCTPTADLPLLPGVTRDEVLDIARQEGIPVETGRYQRSDITSATEVFLTNSTWEVRPVIALDSQSFEVGPLTQRLQRAYDERIESLY
ncbi:aminotransferase class IV [Halovenus rubra]|uniref:Aminotransferase class IV n=2 Tax=Halovenus rubra TaxID=869890 RepID=A0ABD5X6N1_9EURY|nr:aminotransferase class IV [Halovenus rubra]